MGKAIQAHWEPEMVRVAGKEMQDHVMLVAAAEGMVEKAEMAPHSWAESATEIWQAL